MPIKFIVCEDNKSIMDFYKILFESENINSDQIAYFDDGFKAVELIKELTNTNVFLLTDFNMPKVSGGEVLKQAIESNLAYKILRSSLDDDVLLEILEKKFKITTGVTLISKSENIDKLIFEIREFKENFLD